MGLQWWAERCRQHTRTQLTYVAASAVGFASGKHTSPPSTAGCPLTGSLTICFSSLPAGLPTTQLVQTGAPAEAAVPLHL